MSFVGFLYNFTVIVLWLYWFFPIGSAYWFQRKFKICACFRIFLVVLLSGQNLHLVSSLSGNHCKMPLFLTLWLTIAEQLCKEFQFAMFWCLYNVWGLFSVRHRISISIVFSVSVLVFYFSSFDIKAFGIVLLDHLVICVIVFNSIR